MRTTLILKTLAGLATCVLVLPSCSAKPTDTPTDTPAFNVVATTSILGDVVARVTGDQAVVDVVMPAGADPHDFEPSARQVAAIHSADLVVANGLGLEEGLEDVLAAAVAEGVTLLEVGPLVEPLALETSGGLDPHVWLDPIRMSKAVDEIAGALGGVDSSIDWESEANAYREQLIGLDDWISSTLAGIPREERFLVTGHQSFGYFADRYGFEVLGTILPGATTMVEPSAVGFAAIVAVVEESGASAIFTDVTESQVLAEQLVDQVGGAIRVVALYTGGLGEAGSGAETYLDLMRWNTEAIAEVFE